MYGKPIILAGVVVSAMSGCSHLRHGELHRCGIDYNTERCLSIQHEVWSEHPLPKKRVWLARWDINENSPPAVIASAENAIPVDGALPTVPPGADESLPLPPAPSFTAPPAPGYGDELPDPFRESAPPAWQRPPSPVRPPEPGLPADETGSQSPIARAGFQTVQQAGQSPVQSSNQPGEIRKQAAPVARPPAPPRGAFLFRH
ncbi:MAG: hypothetical protein KF777_02580 [Planctomycetaceae bacterium]|nr:hypothetical protein [Planctomycetaceae bacterium]